jgi:hypothetical protein
LAILSIETCNLQIAAMLLSTAPLSNTQCALEPIGYAVLVCGVFAQLFLKNKKLLRLCFVDKVVCGLDQKIRLVGHEFGEQCVLRFGCGFHAN